MVRWIDGFHKNVIHICIIIIFHKKYFNNVAYSLCISIISAEPYITLSGSVNASNILCAFVTDDIQLSGRIASLCAKLIFPCDSTLRP